ncbi:MAG: transcription termination/antitermination NusG family protein [Geminicoccaceae bacterium]|nr:transcription termination/antitermination NusG family protein [Geminicoccaceae bacterium]
MSGAEGGNATAPGVAEGEPVAIRRGREASAPPPSASRAAAERRSAPSPGAAARRSPPPPAPRDRASNPSLATAEHGANPSLATGERWSTPSLATGERWYCVMTQPRREAWAFENLARQGFRGWLPLLTRTVRHARRVRTVKSALFPRYGFLALDLGRDRWRSVNGTLGVVGLLMDEDRPRPVPPGVVEQLQALADAEGAVRYGLEVVPGQRVRVLTGPLADRLAIVTRLDEKGRVALLLEILGAERSVILDREAVLPLP